MSVSEMVKKCHWNPHSIASFKSKRILTFILSNTGDCADILKEREENCEFTTQLDSLQYSYLRM